MVNFPINLQIGNLIVPPHLIFDILAFSFGFYLYITIRRKRKDFLHSEDRWNIILGGVIGALILSRLLASLENPSLFFNPPNFLYYIQGKTIVGGLIGAILGVEITKKILNKKEAISFISKSSWRKKVSPEVISEAIRKKSDALWAECGGNKLHYEIMSLPDKISSLDKLLEELEAKREEKKEEVAS